MEPCDNLDTTVRILQLMLWFQISRAKFCHIDDVNYTVVLNISEQEGNTMEHIDASDNCSTNGICSTSIPPPPINGSYRVHVVATSMFGSSNSRESSIICKWNVFIHHVIAQSAFIIIANGIISCCSFHTSSQKAMIVLLYYQISLFFRWFHYVTFQSFPHGFWRLCNNC